MGVRSWKHLTQCPVGGEVDAGLCAGSDEHRDLRPIAAVVGGPLELQRSASSTTVPIDTPRVRARRFASFRRWSSIERVVRMMSMIAHRTHQTDRAGRGPGSGGMA